MKNFIWILLFFLISWRLNKCAWKIRHPWKHGLQTFIKSKSFIRARSWRVPLIWWHISLKSECREGGFKVWCSKLWGEKLQNLATLLAVAGRHRILWTPVLASSYLRLYLRFTLILWTKSYRSHRKCSQRSSSLLKV